MTSEGDDEVVLDPGNVNTEALHQGLAPIAAHPPYFFPRSLENGSEVNWQQEVHKNRFLPVFISHLFDIPLAHASIPFSLSLSFTRL